MSDEGKGRWVEKTPTDWARAAGVGPGRWRCECDLDAPVKVWRYWKWEEALPLPDKPGVRFWGQRANEDPKWWFSADAGAGIEFVSKDIGCVIAGRHHQLTRLPEPED